jgi:hypothetical protein
MAEKILVGLENVGMDESSTAPEIEEQAHRHFAARYRSNRCRPVKQEGSRDVIVFRLPLEFEFQIGACSERPNGVHSMDALTACQGKHQVM